MRACMQERSRIAVGLMTIQMCNSAVLFTIQANTILCLFSSPKHKVTLHEHQPAEEGRTGIQLWLAART